MGFVGIERQFMKFHGFLRLKMLVLTVLATGQAVAESCTSLEDLEWILGSWQAVNGQTTTLESWERIIFSDQNATLPVFWHP